MVFTVSKIFFVSNSKGCLYCQITLYDRKEESNCRFLITFISPSKLVSPLSRETEQKQVWNAVSILILQLQLLQYSVFLLARYFERKKANIPNPLEFLTDYESVELNASRVFCFTLKFESCKLLSLIARDR